MKKSLTYKDAGVDIKEADKLIASISSMAKKTYRPEVVTGIGSFGALFALDIIKYKEPVIVSGTDGVGTKLDIAIMMDVHDTIGIDLVAMCVNDIITSGAEPLFFLDYLATSKLRAEQGSQIIKGIAEGCLQAGCSLIGGETAEMPGFYPEGVYDLSGFAVGVVEKSEIINGADIKAGDVIIGLPSRGVHSNGFSLVRKTLFEHAGMDVATNVKELGKTIGKALLEPTIIYVKTVEEIKKRVKIKGMAHITGGGITDNLPRTLPKGLGAEIDRSSWIVPAIFRLIQEKGNINDAEMLKTFNMGIGFMIVVDKEDAEKISEYNVVGRVVEGDGVRYV
ncbi:MAG: phosphoribosylformylglycinamidine cyclo-ligase [Nitrospirae bacterium]|nr:phosphoribosylformylglycinamidine cyclo-ligase [Nitrospirota bacterium]